MTIVVNGEVVLDKIDPKLPADQPPNNLLEWMWIGKTATAHDAGTSLVGEFSDVNIWFSALSQQDMVDWTTCQTSGGEDFKGSWGMKHRIALVLPLFQGHESLSSSKVIGCASLT